MSWPWSHLGLSGPAGLSEVRHAYAEKLKTTHPEEDPEGFQRLHSAYQLASRMARKRRVPPPESRWECTPEPPLPGPEAERDFDFDCLLAEEDGVALSRPRPEMEWDFDFERLLAEGEAERAEERRRRIELFRKARRRQSVFRVAVCAAMILATLSWLWSVRPLSIKRPAPDPREQVCQYLEEDYGEEILSLYNGNDTRFDNVFSLRRETSKMFLAGPDGNRDVKSGRLGYTTNYPEMMVLWRLKEFVRNRTLNSVDEVDGGRGLNSWETSGAYLITLKFHGDGQTITDLAELLETMAREDWYQVRVPEFEIILCSGPLKDGRLILDRYKSSDKIFDAEAARQLYEESFAHAYCAQLLRDNGLDRDFVHGGTEPYTLTNGGMAELKGEARCRLYGLDGDGQTAMEYYFSTTGGSVCCVPGGFWAEGGREEDIQFYKLVHVEATQGLLDVYYPWLTAR